MGPWCPIYGIGASFILEGSADFNSGLEVFVMTVFVGSFIELAAGILLKLFFHQRWWDYSKYPLNVGGYICPLFSFGWGICGVFLVRIIHPPIHYLYENTPEMFVYILLTVLTVFFLIDLILTILNLLKINRHIKEIDEMSTAIRHLSDQIGERVYEESTEVLQSKWVKKVQLDMEELKQFSKTGFTKNEFYRLREKRIKERGYFERRLLKQFENARSTKYKEAFEELKKSIQKKKK